MLQPSSLPSRIGTPCGPCRRLLPGPALRPRESLGPLRHECLLGGRLREQVERGQRMQRRPAAAHEGAHRSVETSLGGGSTARDRGVGPERAQAVEVGEERHCEVDRQVLELVGLGGDVLAAVSGARDGSFDATRGGAGDSPSSRWLGDGNQRRRGSLPGLEVVGREGRLVWEVWVEDDVSLEVGELDQKFLPRGLPAVSGCRGEGEGEGEGEDSDPAKEGGGAGGGIVFSSEASGRRLTRLGDDDGGRLVEHPAAHVAVEGVPRLRKEEGSPAARQLLQEEGSASVGGL